MQHKKAILILFAAAILWSSGGVLIKSIPWPPLALAGGRSSIAALWLLALMLVRGRRPKFNALTIGCALCYAACTMTFVVATKLTSAANAILLQYSSPIWVAIFGAWILRERPGRTDWMAIAMTFVGIILFFADKLSAEHFWGNIVGLFSGVFFGFLAILLRKQKDAAPLDSILLGTVLGGVICLPALASAPVLSVNGYLALFVLATFQLALPYAMYAKAIRHVSALEAVLIPVIEPILNPIWVMLALGERPGPWAIVGGVIVLASSLFKAWISITSSARSKHTSLQSS